MLIRWVTVSINQVLIEDTIERCIQLAKKMNVSIVFPLRDSTRSTNVKRKNDDKKKKMQTKKASRVQQRRWVID